MSTSQKPFIFDLLLWWQACFFYIDGRWYCIHEYEDINGVEDDDLDITITLMVMMMRRCTYIWCEWVWGVFGWALLYPGHQRHIMGGRIPSSGYSNIQTKTKRILCSEIVEMLRWWHPFWPLDIFSNCSKESKDLILGCINEGFTQGF